MYTDNRSILQKADLVLQDLTDGGGVLQPEHAKKFIRLLIKDSVIMKHATVVPMSSPKKTLPKIKFGKRILRRGKEGVAVDENERAKPDFSKEELNAELFRAEVPITDEALEDNIERGELRQTIMDLMAEGIARDMDEILINGDVLSPDPYLSTMDGVLKQSVSHIVNAAGLPISKDILRDMLKTLPSEHLRDKRKMRFFISSDADIDYRYSLSGRAGAVGDKFLEEDTPVLYSGVPLMPVPLFPDNLGAAQDKTTILLCNPKNIHVGIWRKIRIESERDISRGVLKIVASLRFDVKYVDEHGVCKAIEVGA